MRCHTSPRSALICPGGRSCRTYIQCQIQVDPIHPQALQLGYQHKPGHQCKAESCSASSIDASMMPFIGYRAERFPLYICPAFTPYVGSLKSVQSTDLLSYFDCFSIFPHDEYDIRFKDLTDKIINMPNGIEAIHTFFNETAYERLL